jgi:DNA primase
VGDWIDFAELRARIPLEDVLLGMYQLGERLKRSGRKLVGPCPIHGGDNPRAFQADLEKNVWYCHTGCRRGGNVLDFVAAIEKLPIRDAALKLQAAYLGGRASDTPPAASNASALPVHAPRAPPPGAPPTPPHAATTPSSPSEDTNDRADASSEAEATNLPLSLRLTLAHDHPHLLKDRGLSLDIATRFGVGYCARGLLRGMIAIPIHDEDGDLVAYAGRRLKSADIREHGKYKFPKGFRKELVLYNLERVKALGVQEGLALVEGFFSVLALAGHGIQNAVASMGCSLSEAQADLVAEHASHVAILYDGDEAGRGGSLHAQALLEKRNVPCTRILLPEGTKPDNHPARLLRWAISGARLLGLRELGFAPQPARQEDRPSEAE